jgi:hypothetical protein
VMKITPAATHVAVQRPRMLMNKRPRPHTAPSDCSSRVRKPSCVARRGSGELPVGCGRS